MKNEKINQMKLTFKAISINEGFARVCVAAFCAQANPTVDEITDIKTAVSEAVTNCVVHAYPNGKGDITIIGNLTSDTLMLEVSDTGIGIDDIEKAKQPFYSTKLSSERSGMGFTVMESFMDSVDIIKNKTKGVTVVMSKKLKAQEEYKVIGG